MESTYNKDPNKEHVHVFTCLHCNEPFVIHDTDFNCKILRHGVYKSNLQPINPHASKEECDALVSSGQIYGCAGPLLITTSKCGDGDGEFRVVICDYI
jgi:hypothetical protein